MLKFISKLFIFSLIIGIAPHKLYSESKEGLYIQDAYFLDNSEVLLYKVINWWYIESNKDSKELCHKPIKVQSKANIQVEYNKSKKELYLFKKDTFAKLISFLDKSTYLKNIYLNKKYFKNSKAKNINKNIKLTFINITQKEFKKIQKIRKNISFVIEGKVGGLFSRSGKISLHQSGDFYRICPLKSQSKFPISFSVVDNNTDEVLSRYIVVRK